MNGQTVRQGVIPALVLTLLLAVVALLVTPAPTVSAQQHAAATDSRQRLRLTAAEASAVRAEMRQMLASVSGVVQGLARTDLLAVEKAATASGMAAAVDPQLEKKLPRQFLDLGERTHHGFDALAASAKSGAPAAELLTRLAGVTSNCVACHAIYRLGDTR